MRIALAVLGISVLAVTHQGTGAAAQDKAFRIYGPTPGSCSKWTAGSAAERQQYEWWLLGFVSGADHSNRSTRPLRETNAAAIAGSVGKYCAEHPQESIASAAVALVGELSSRSQ